MPGQPGEASASHGELQTSLLLSAVWRWGQRHDSTTMTTEQATKSATPCNKKSKCVRLMKLNHQLTCVCLSANNVRPPAVPSSSVATAATADARRQKMPNRKTHVI